MRFQLGYSGKVPLHQMMLGYHFHQSVSLPGPFLIDRLNSKIKLTKEGKNKFQKAEKCCLCSEGEMKEQEFDEDIIEMQICDLADKHDSWLDLARKKVFAIIRDFHND